ncbi:PepSY domain-containing protein [Prolixibacteraceae bacterium JC049]|nr:PepSY domain-containing protein [Prolixibacteraceae bacterium JC049]
MKISSRIYKISRWIHKYFGLLLLLFLFWMSVSGVLLNHPQTFRKISLPSWAVPEAYHPENWNRSTLKGVVNVKPDSLLLYGNQGVFITNSIKENISPFMKGEFPVEAWEKRTNHVVFDKKYNRILAATNKGLYYTLPLKNNWIKLELPSSYTPIKKIIKLPHNWLLVTDSEFFVSPNAQKLDFKIFTPNRNTEETSVSLITLFFQLHDGSIWGLPGRLLWDLFGLALAFLCVSAFYIWYYPKRWKRSFKRKNIAIPAKEKQKRSFHFKYHKKIGWYLAIPLILITLTGMFLRPPLLVSLIGGKIEKKWYPAITNNNAWYHKIRNGFYDSENEKIVLDCSDGIWSGTLEQSFEKQRLPLRIFAMGATVFEEEKPGTWLVGSFGGLHEFNIKNQYNKSLLPQIQRARRGAPGNILVTSYVRFSEQESYVLGHYKGLCYLDGTSAHSEIKMPETIKKAYKMPLWNFLFELHNARIFKGWVGAFYMLIIPLGGLLCLLIMLSGIYDYWFTRKKKSWRT